MAAHETLVEDTYINDNMILRLTTQKELGENIENLYVLISSTDLRIPAILEQISRKSLKKMTKLADYLESVKGQILRI